MANIMPADSPSRRGFLAASAALAATGSLAGADPLPAGIPADIPVDLVPHPADMGNLFPDILRLAQSHPFAMRFTGDRFKNHADFKAAAREKIFDVLQYRP